MLLGWRVWSGVFAHWHNHPGGGNNCTENGMQSSWKCLLMSQCIFFPISVRLSRDEIRTLPSSSSQRLTVFIYYRHDYNRHFIYSENLKQKLFMLFLLRVKLTKDEQKHPSWDGITKPNDGNGSNRYNHQFVKESDWFWQEKTSCNLSDSAHTLRVTAVLVLTCI